MNAKRNPPGKFHIQPGDPSPWHQGTAGPIEQIRGDEKQPQPDGLPMSKRTKNVNVSPNRILHRAFPDDLQPNTSGVNEMDPHVEDVKAPPIVVGLRNKPYDLSIGERGTGSA